MNHPDGSGPFGTPSFAPTLAHIETGEKLLETLDSKYVLIVKELDDLKQVLDRFEKIATNENIQNLQNSIKKLSKNQIYDLSFLLGFYAQRQSWIDPKEIADEGNRHTYRVVKKNLIGQDSRYPWARGPPAIRDLCEWKTISGKVMFIPKGLIAEFAVSFFHLRKSLNLLSDAMQLMEDFAKFTESLTPLAARFLELADKSDEKLKQYPEIPQSVLDTLKNFASMRKNHFDTLLQSERKKPDSAFFHQTNEGIKNTLGDVRNSSNLDVMLILKMVPLEKAKGLFDSHKQNMGQCAMFLQFCKSFIEFEAKNRDLRRIRNEIATLMSKFSDVDKMTRELISDYAKGKITKEQYEKQQMQLDKVLAEIVEKLIMAAKPFDLRRGFEDHQAEF